MLNTVEILPDLYSTPRCLPFAVNTYVLVVANTAFIWDEKNNTEVNIKRFRTANTSEIASNKE